MSRLFRLRIPMPWHGHSLRTLCCLRRQRFPVSRTITASGQSSCRLLRFTGQLECVPPGSTPQQKFRQMISTPWSRRSGAFSVKNGNELVRFAVMYLIRTSGSNTGIVFISARNEEERLRERGFIPGANNFLSKFCFKRKSHPPPNPPMPVVPGCDDGLLKIPIVF